jgi:hypothetical protein
MLDLVRATMLAFFATAGYDQDHAQAMMRQARIESGFNYCAIAPWGSDGLFQWNGVRRRKLHALYGPGCVPLQQQLEFADQEMRSGLYECFWRASGPTAFKELRRTFGYGGRC